MSEVLFYQLDRRPLESVLAVLLEKSLERGWRVVVQAASSERIDALDTQLWTYRDDSFLPHGTAVSGPADLQPVYLTTVDENPNTAQVCFLVDGAAPQDISAYERVVYLFDGRREDEKELARKQWSRQSKAGHDVTYWLQDDSGRWVKKA